VVTGGGTSMVNVEYRLGNEMGQLVFREPLSEPQLVGY
jgi:hypothetical protein